MAEIGTYYITVMPSMNKFTSAVKKELGGLGGDAGNEFKTSFGDILKGSAIGTMLGNLGSMLGSEIMGGLSTGISRLDTLKNFPKVMESLGYTSTQADSSIQEIMKHLDGLPTATQDVVAMTQAFADSTGDLDLATKAALGFNDMMLASGASTGEVTQAQGVLNRVLGKGSATVAQWQSLQSVMPAQLAAVARELGGESMSVEELREALNDGEISWNDFLAAVVRLDTEGSGAMSSFYDQAVANSHGIGTALANVPNRIGAGWAEILDALGREDISKTIDTMSYGIRDAMTRVGDAVEWLKWTILGSSIDESLGRIFGDVKDFFSETFSISVPDIKNFARDCIDLVEGALKWLADHGEVVKSALGGIAGALAVLAGWKLGTDLTKLPGILGGITAALGANPFMIAVVAIGAVVGALWTFFTQTETGQKMWSDFCDLLSTTWEGLKEDWGVLMDVLGQEWESFKAWLDGIPEWWQGVLDSWNAKVEGWKQWWSDSWDTAVESVKTAGENIKTGLSDAISAATEWVTSKVDEFVAWWDKSWQDAADSIVKVGNDIKNGVSTAWTNLKTNTQTKWNEMKANASAAWTNLKTTVSNKANEAKAAASNAWENLKSSTSDKWNSIKTTVTEKVTSMKDAVVDKFNSLKSSVSDKWESIKSSISDKIIAAKNKVKEMVESIKSLFDFHITWPHIPLPHFSVSGSANPLEWLTSGVPKISVDWYAKGGVFDGASLIGVGEKGPEAVLPLNERTMGDIAGLIANKMEVAPSVVVTGNSFYVRKESDIDAIADAIARRTTRQRGARL